MLVRLKKKTQGFTIIEVLIVLAIAGLILLIVFLAVPALQRNSRNTQRKSDVSAIGAAVTEFQNNNAGAIPNAYTAPNITAGGTTTPAGVKLGYYTGINFATGDQSALAATVDNAPTVVTGAKCGAAGATVAAGASARSTAIQYLIESTTTLVPTCSEL